MRPLSEFVAEVEAGYGHIRHRRFTTRLGPIVLPTKGAAQNLLQAIKNAAPLESVLADEFTPVILAALDWHPGKAEKLRFGCRGFMVRHNPPRRPDNDLGFWIVTERPPPTLVEFSYLTCFGPSRATIDPLRQMNEAGRFATGMSQWQFKQRHFLKGMLCPRCHAVMDAPEVDHVDPKFRDLIRAFRQEYGDPPQGFVKHPAHGWQFANPDDGRFFEEYHDAHAVRELVCKGCNMAAERGR